MTVKLQLRNGLADCNQVWSTFRDQIAMHITQVMDEVSTSARTHMRTCRFATSPYLRNGYTDYIQILCVVGGVVGVYINLRCGTAARVHLRTLFRISKTAERIALKFVVCLGDH